MEENSGFRFGEAVKAGFLATLIMTIVMYLFGTDSMKMLGGMIMGNDTTPAMTYVAGGILHFGVGIFFALIYALIFAPIAINSLMKTLIYSVIITATAYYGAPKMPEVIGKIKGEVMAAANPCNPCAKNPCSMNPCAAKNSCNPCNPCGGDSKKALTRMWVNHFIFALIVGMIYRRRKNP